MNNIENFFKGQSTPKIAQEMLGHKISYYSENSLVSGIIVETEAYLGQKDAAAHAYDGRHTKSNDPLYQDPGTIYIYSIHSYLDMDISAQEKNNPNGILIRGIEPCEGIDIMENNRKVSNKFDLTNGPAKWMRAFGILDKKLSGTQLNDGPLHFSSERIKNPQNIETSSRIGIKNKGIWTSEKLRYFVQGNPYVSKTKKSDFNLDNYGWK